MSDATLGPSNWIRLSFATFLVMTSANGHVTIVVSSVRFSVATTDTPDDTDPMLKD